MSANLSAVPKLQFFDNNGNPLVGGKLYTYAAGTTTPLATYTDASAGTPNTNPIILDSRGEANVWLLATTYKFLLTDSTDATIWTVDNISNSLSLSQILAASGSAASPPYTFASDTDTGMYLAAVGQLGLTVGGVPVIRSTSTILTIGQSGGANDVDVTHYGDTAQTGNVTQTGNVIQTGNWTLTGDVNVTGAAVFNEAGADKDFRVESDTNANMLFVDASTDRVGVGTNTPAYVLDVNVASGSFRVRDATGGNDFVVRSIAGPITAIGPVANVPLAITTNDLTRVHITATGEVGVGTTSPQGKFNVSSGTSFFGANSQTYSIGVGYSQARVNSGQTYYVGATDSTAPDMVFSNAAGTERARLTDTGNWQFNSGYGSVATAYGCRAWINFDGTAVVSPASMTGVRGSGNISSVLDNGTGDYTVNFTTAMPDANYAVVMSSKGENNTTITTNNNPRPTAYALAATGSVRIFGSTLASASADAVNISVAIFR